MTRPGLGRSTQKLLPFGFAFGPISQRKQSNSLPRNSVNGRTPAISHGTRTAALKKSQLLLNVRLGPVKKETVMSNSQPIAKKRNLIAGRPPTALSELEREVVARFVAIARTLGVY